MDSVRSGPFGQIFRPDNFVFGMFSERFLLKLKSTSTVELQWLEHLWNHENISETGGVRANECYS